MLSQCREKCQPEPCPLCTAVSTRWRQLPEHLVINRFEPDSACEKCEFSPAPTWQLNLRRFVSSSLQDTLRMKGPVREGASRCNSLKLHSLNKLGRMIPCRGFTQWQVFEELSCISCRL